MKGADVINALAAKLKRQANKDMSTGNGDQRIEKKVGRDDTETAKSLQRMAEALHETLNPLHESGQATTGFCLLVFGFDKPGTANYVSNAKMVDMIEALKETIKRLEDNLTSVQETADHKME